MSKINILDSNIYNKISAGEVVERPASVVKELIENSLDAGAKNIEIEIYNGGIDKITITDDGCGIENDDIVKAFLPHATSKISKADDLVNIKTMGFRGEALASIASVSQVELQSKTNNDELGAKIELEGGKVISNSFVPMQTGTVINVMNLFFNVPARKKFLKKPKLEENAITDIVSRIIMTHYNVCFKYIVDGKTIYETAGTDLEEALFVIYGKQILDNVIKIDYSKYDIEISGFIGKPIYARPNRTYQTLSINNRYVTSSNISFAVQRGYENYLMKGKFPFFVLNINIPSNSVDVNVHPQKMEVRIENDGRIFSALYKSVQDCLLKNRELATFTDFGAQFQNILSDNNDDSNVDVPTTDNAKKETYEEDIQITDKKVITNNNNSQILDKFKNIELSSFEFNKQNDVNVNNKLDNIIFSSPEIPYNKNLNEIKPNLKETKIEYEQNTFLDESYKILSTLFDTYILIEQGNNFILIDQHASHERILYEELKERIQNKKFSSHKLFVPYIFDVSPAEDEIIRTLMPSLEELGFEIEEFGNLSYKMNAIPFDDYINFNCKEFIENILQTNYKSMDLKNSFNDFLAQRACKSAVKGGDKLSKEEIDYLINEIIETNTPMFCPHGRPIAIKFSKKDVEKWFKRII